MSHSWLLGLEPWSLYAPLAAGSRTVVSVRVAAIYPASRPSGNRQPEQGHAGTFFTEGIQVVDGLCAASSPSPIPALTCLYVSGSLSHLASPHSPDACVCRAGAQVQGRLWRPGQKAPHVYTYRLLSTGTCEELYAPQGSNCTPQIAHAFLIRGSRLIRIFGRQQAKMVR